MTATNPKPRSAGDVLESVRDLAPAITARAPEIEAARRLPGDLLDDLVATGVFRLLRPGSHGGLGADLLAGLRVVEALAHADASTGWTVMIGSASWCDLAALPRSTFDTLFAGAPDAITAGVFSPGGSITPAAGGYRVSGRWGFASGCEHADWIYANCVEGVAGDSPRFRIAVFAPDEVVIEDTWRVSGLVGTGSHHFHAEGVVVPAERTLAPLDDPPCVDTPIVHVPVPAMLALLIAGVAVGCAQGALDDILALATNKVPLLAGGPLAASPTFQLEYATAGTELQAARALVHQAARAAWDTASRGEPFTLAHRATIRAAATWATERAAAVARTAYRAGGGTSLYATSPLQRRLRDSNAITQHFLVRHDVLTTAGAILAGHEPELIVF